MTLRTELKELKKAAHVMPGPDAVLPTLERVKLGGPYDELFFAELRDTGWLPVLEQHGFFAGIPEKDSATSPRARYSERLPFLALARLAEVAADAVTAILIRLPLVTAMRMTDQVLRCIAGVSGRRAITSLRPLAVYLAESSSHTHGVWIEEVLKAWTKAGATAEAKAILRAFVLSIANRSRADQYRPGTGWQMAEIDQKVVESLCTGDPMEIAATYFDALSRWAALRRECEPSRTAEPVERDPAQETPATLWLEDFKDPPSNLRELEGSLAGRLYVACARIYSTQPQCIGDLDQMLRSDRWELFERLRWQLYADFPTDSFAFARGDVLALIPHFGRIDFAHEYEFAQLLSKHTEQHGAAFLAPEDVSTFLSSVLAGPLDRKGNPADIDKERFWRRQLQPIEPLLTGVNGERYRQSVPAEACSPIEFYKPVRSGGAARMVEHVSPVSHADLAAKPNPELWEYLNTWKPSARYEKREWWIDEDIGALGKVFAQLVETQPNRFSAQSAWWTKLHRPAILSQPLERAAERLGNEATAKKPVSPGEWENWFGLAQWIVANPARSEGLPKAEENDSAWARMLVARFLKAALKSKDSVPPLLIPPAHELIKRLISDPDPRLADGGRMGDWLTTAINSARGDAIDLALDVAIRTKESGKDPEAWIFEAIRQRLTDPNESPAVFALLGSRLRLFAHLFGDQLAGSPELLFPPAREEHKTAAILAHFQYDNPMAKVVQVFPEIVNQGLDLLKGSGNDETREERLGRNYATRLGMHIAFYFWNELLPPVGGGDQLLHRFFSVVPSNVRANVIGQIGNTFEKASPAEVTEKLQRRVMEIWEQTRAAILATRNSVGASAGNFDDEFLAFVDWIRCECLPFHWRLRNLNEALSWASAGPRPDRLVEFIAEQSENPERLRPMLDLVRTLIDKPSDELKWSLQEDKIRPLLERGLRSDNVEVRDAAESAQEKLLRQGFLSLLDVGSAASTEKSGQQ
jgi:hypothetical protein